MDDNQFIKELLESAGKLAMERFGKVSPAMKDNKTYVTEADLTIQSYLRKELERRFPGDGLVGEEQHLQKLPFEGKRYWIIDPIDGTASFVSGLPIWGIAIGLIDKFQPVAGFFYMPVTNDYFQTKDDGIVCRNDRPQAMKTHEPIHRESVLLTASRFHRRCRISPDYPGKIRSLGSSIAHICYTATGSADAFLLEEAYIWDLAAGLPLLTNNGGLLSYLHGSDFVITERLLSGEKAPYPLLGGPAETIDQFTDLISYI